MADAEVPLIDAAANEAGSDGATDVAVGEGGPLEGGVDAAISKLGDICTDQPECNGTYDFCAIIPGQKQGYCTSTGCTVKPNDCPAPYVCMDLSAFAPGLTACIKL